MDQLAKFCGSRYLLQVNAFSKVEDKLKNIAIGLVASDNVNIICIRSYGESVLRKMEGTSLLTFTFQKMMQAEQIPSLSSILGKKTEIVLDPELLFQGLITVC